MPLRCIIRFFGWLWPRENYPLLLWHKLVSIQLKGINGPKTHSWSVKTQKNLMSLFQSKTKIIIPFDIIYLLRIEKIGIPLFLLKWHYNPFFPKTKISPFIVIAFFLVSPRSTGIVPFPSHVTQSHSHLLFTRVQSQVRAGLFSGVQLHKFCPYPPWKLPR